MGAAAQRYFGKQARQLTLAEAAMLAGLVQSPSRLAPSHNPNGAERRARVVLADMAEQKLISADAEKFALTHPARAVKPAGADSLNYVADWVMDAVNDYVGTFDQDIVVQTSIDPALQGVAEHALDDALREKGEKFGISEGAIVAMTPDGVVRALVGGRSYAESQFNRAIAAKRQPGSAFKPFVYLTALEHGLTPDTVREDAPISVKGWKPENYEHDYLGPVTLTRALANSLNTVSVRLILEVGPAAVARTAYRMGIELKARGQRLAGAGHVRCIAARTRLRLCAFCQRRVCRRAARSRGVKAADGTILYARSPQALGRIVDARYVAMMNAMLHETIASGTARHADLPGWQAAGKTGTSQDYRDAWFIGYTSHMVTGVWLGNDDDSPTRKAVGGGLPVDIWSRFMRTAHQGVAPSALPGLGGGGWPGASLFQSSSPAPAGGRAAPPKQEGLDSWLLDKLFGRH